MGYQRQQFRAEPKRVRHARVSFCVAHCIDCQVQLSVTHVIVRFGGRCRRCWSGLTQSVSELVG